MERVHQAIEFAFIKHAGQRRKGTDIPYIVHPMEVMYLLVLEQCEEDVIIAGILHDTIEDTDTTFEELQTQFGDHVAEIVASESEDKSKSWEERKRTTIEHLKECSDEVALCCLADKLSNITSIINDYNKLGEKVWERFSKSKDRELWYYAEIAHATERLSQTSLWQRYEQCVSKMIWN